VDDQRRDYELDASDGNVTRVLNDLRRGDAAAAEHLLPLVYDELRRLAAHKMAQEAPGHTLQRTALVHEAYLRLVGDGNARGWDSRGHFFAAAAEAMRRILIEAARRKAARKHGGALARIEVSDDLLADEAPDAGALLALDEALQRLQQVDPESYQLVMLRYFAGLTIDEAAAALDVSPRTAKRNWSYARAWLKREIERE
jgi:RNA polymerase sigma factor (TIGR02999 family)